MSLSVSCAISCLVSFVALYARHVPHIACINDNLVNSTQILLRECSEMLLSQAHQFDHELCP